MLLELGSLRSGLEALGLLLVICFCRRSYLRVQVAELSENSDGIYIPVWFLSVRVVK
jgi:hypothetical protein